MSGITEPRRLLEDVIGSQYFAVLNSMGEGFPYSNLISFAVTEDLKLLIFITNRNTRKFKNVIENSNVSLLIDNRTNRPDDVEKAFAITIIGTAREETGNRSFFQSIFVNRHPQLNQFASEPENALIVVKIREYIIAAFDKTQRIII